MKLHSVVFYTNNIDIVDDFYINTLGLKLDYRQENKFISFWFTNDVKLGIKKAIEEREVPGAQTAFIEVDDIYGWYEKVKNMKLDIRKELVEESWATNFSILDPDKNKLQFVEIKK